MAILDSLRLILRSSRSKCSHSPKKPQNFKKSPPNPGVYYSSGPLARKVCANNASVHRTFSDNFKGFGVFFLRFGGW